MQRSQVPLLLLGTCVAATAFVVGRTTSPAGVSAAGGNAGIVTGDAARQISAEVRRDVEASLRGKIPELVAAGIAAHDQEAKERSQAVWHSVAGTLRLLRSQLALYRLQHKDRFPTFRDMEEWYAMVRRTDADGRFVPDGAYGPYLYSGMSNPATGMSKVAAAGSATKDAGWTYDERTGEIRAVLTHEATEALGAVPADLRGAVEFAGGD